ncbi:hypothetical protein [Thiohalophilus sp.]|uniref:hypothetical protein n=1 Tax=Thiohalophilus sp. TaxID=3028392 RepID=UPI0039764150
MDFLFYTSLCMDIQSSSLPHPTIRGSAQRYSRNLVVHQTIPRAVEVAAPAPRPASSALTEASLIEGRPGGLSPQQAVAVYRAVNRISDQSGVELLNRIDAHA